METKKAPLSEELMSELLQGILDDVKNLRQSVTELAAKDVPDYQEDINSLTQAVQSLKQQHNTAPSGESSQLVERLDRIENLFRQRPEYRISQYVRYGGYMFGLLVILLVGVTWLALDWKQERDAYAPAYEQANWRVRYTKQANPDFYAYMEGIFAKEAPKVQQWTLEQEQADQKRDLARQATEQAKAMNAQADQLEGKASVKGKKK